MPQHDLALAKEIDSSSDRRDRLLVRTRGGATRRRLLLVDDDPLVARMLSHAAFECGYEPDCAANIADFRREYDSAEPEVVLLDLSLKGGDGIEVMRFLAERKSRALVLIVSGFDPRVIEAAERLGKALGLRIGGCLAKPIFVKELADAIEAGRRSVQREPEVSNGDVCL